ncbi:hypothetical protein [Actinomadura harenae]|uniref:Uncharacterized protein n=1 Tax=Actinomadura harenae TaxID=2483351 RepID=A0A3M2LV34_9ACTN|nr:hypothetical protein [Actinomadura harenae]RMI39875.1 hypothetical protein EBO15_28320 [Actinomadura harenae]
MTATSRKAPRPADDEPFDFNLNTVQKEVELRPWRVVWGPENKRWTFAHMQELDTWDLIAAAGKGDNAATIEMFKAALGPDQFREFRKIPLPQWAAEELFNAWGEHCGVDVGESSGSTD